MKAEFTISRRDVYTTGGSFDSSLYEVQTSMDNEYLQDIQLECAEDLITLRDVLSEYIERNNITQAILEVEIQ